MTLGHSGSYLFCQGKHLDRHGDGWFIVDFRQFVLPGAIGAQMPLDVRYQISQPFARMIAGAFVVDGRARAVTTPYPGLPPQGGKEPNRPAQGLKTPLRL